MSDLDKYVSKRKKADARFARGFARGYERGYEDFKIGVLLRQAREKRGITQEQLAHRIQTTKSAISRVENHAEDIRLSTLEKIADALELELSIKLA